ncbi:MAG: hypothetical protein HXX20_03765 [Chloroflexi bacterium]|nr:hypothetical protein [Chloroflexota bacterium]
MLMETFDSTRIVFPGTIVKRDGKVVSFEIERIEKALHRCFASFNRTPGTSVHELARRVANIVVAKGTPPTVESVQDIVEMVLQAAGEFEAAKRYILYRAEHAREREERPVPEEVRQAFAQSSHYFPTQLQQFQFFDKYSRFDYKLGRRETWVETVNRTVNFLYELAGSRLEAETYERLRRGILEMKVMPSMRLLAMAGPAARRSNITIYNCSYQPVESIDSFVEALIISMSGCGVGFSVEREYIENFPRIRRQTGQMAPTFTVPDSAEGWAQALRIGLETWFEGGDIRFDLTRLRQAGAPLRTKGGRASGPEPLRAMLEFVRSRLFSRQGSFLRSIDAHDIMCIVGNAAVSGGVRRTAMLSLFDYDDLEMRHCKNGDFERENSQRWNANNSAVWPEGGLSQLEVAHQVLDMVESGRGEPGIFNRQAALDLKPERRSTTMTMPDGSVQPVRFGTNPCVTGDTWVMTEDGPRQVNQLVGKSHLTLVNGELYPTTEVGFWHTGDKPVSRLLTKEGYELRLTENHKVEVVTYHTPKTERTEWRELSALKPGDLVKLHDHRASGYWTSYGNYAEGWLLGSLLGDGTFSSRPGLSVEVKTQAHLEYWGEKSEYMAQQALGRVKESVRTRADLSAVAATQPGKYRVSSAGLAELAQTYGIRQAHKEITSLVEQASSDFYLGFLQSLFDADGTISGSQAKGVSVRLSQSNLQTLKAVQRMLLRLGIASTIYQNRRAEGFRLMPDGKGGLKEYFTQAQHELAIAGANLITFATQIGFSEPFKAERLKRLISVYKRTPNREFFRATVASITPDGVEAVYDCSVPGPNAFDANGFMAHNCGEIILRPWAFCNLSAVIARQDDTLESLQEKVELATIIGTIQATATYFPGLRPIWQRNCEEERLLGVDITGQLDSVAAQDAEIKARLRQYTQEVNRQTAAKLGVNQAAALTCVKPSGNTSQMVNCASGLHARWSPYYVRNVRVAGHSPIFRVLREAGVPMDPENGQTPENATTWVIHFPVKSPEGAITRNRRTAIEQCNYWLQNKLYWTEHNPSITITYRPDEVLDLLSWIWEHRSQLGGMAFLPTFDALYAQLPYIEISAEEYHKLAAEFPEVDFSKLYRYELSDLTTAAQELACSSGSCEVDL